MNTAVAAADIIEVPGSGRDSGKTYKVPRIDPLTFAGYVLRLVAALRVESYEGLLADIRASLDSGDAPIDTIMHVLQGCDPKAVHDLIKDAIGHVLISPDPKMPIAGRSIMISDIAELKTLGDLLMTIAQIHFGPTE